MLKLLNDKQSCPEHIRVENRPNATQSNKSYQSRSHRAQPPVPQHSWPRMNKCLKTFHFLRKYAEITSDCVRWVRVRAAVDTKGVDRGEGGNPPPETEKIVVDKWCYFRRLYF